MQRAQRRAHPASPSLDLNKVPPPERRHLLAEAARRAGLTDEGPTLRAARAARAEREQLGQPEPEPGEHYNNRGQVVEASA